MNNKILSKSGLLLFVSALTGCTSYSISPDLEEFERAHIPVNTFSFEFEAPYKNEPWEKIEGKFRDITKSILPVSSEVVEQVKDSQPTHISIHINVRSHGGACAQEYLTGLSLGLIPSWCTRHEMYSFRYELMHKGQVCSAQKYVVDETSYGHIIFLPFGLFELATGIHRKPLNLFNESLSSFLQKGCQADQ